MPSPRIVRTTIVNSGCFAYPRTATRTSCQKELISASRATVVPTSHYGDDRQSAGFRGRRSVLVRLWDLAVRSCRLFQVPRYTVCVVADRGKGRLVYSTGVGAVCPDCGWPERDCKCSQSAATESIPSRIVAKLRMEKKGRGGKTVTVVDNLPNNAAFLKDLCQDLKRACGTGGAVLEDGVELQGDLRERLRELLLKKEFIVKG